MPNWRDLEKEHSRLEGIRAREETLWRELARMLEEDGGDLDIRQDKERTRVDSYDSTPLYAKDDFVGGLFTEAMNPAERFFSFGIPDKALKEWGPVKSWLWNYADLTFGSLDPAMSNFYLEATPWLGDMSVFSSGFMAQEENVGAKKIITRTLPVRECYKDVDADGETNRFHRKYELNGVQAKKKWRDAAPAMRDDQTFEFIQAIYLNEDYRPGADGPKGMPWVSCHVSPNAKDFSIEKRFHEFPIHEIQWKRRSSRAWGTGPGHKALADMNMNDELARSVITSVQFDAEPMLLVSDEDIMTAADIAPHNIIYGAINEHGKERVKALQRSDNAQLPITVQEAVRQQIREAFHFSLAQIAKRPQMTLGEFMGWKEEKLRLLAPHLVCIHRGLGSFIARRARLLARMGRVPPAPPELQGQALTVEFISPFAQVQKATKARAAMQVGQAALALKELDPEIPDNINGDALMRSISDGLSGDPELVVDPRVRDERRKARAQQMAQDVQLERGAQQAGIVAEVAHASQAMTSAKTRGKAA